MNRTELLVKLHDCKIGIQAGLTTVSYDEYDGLIDVDSNVSLSPECIGHDGQLHDWLKFGKVTGYFSANNVGLTGFKNFPKRADGINVLGSHLEDLTGFSTECFWLNADDSKYLTSLRGARWFKPNPSFFASRTALSSLLGLPSQMDSVVVDTAKLTSLEGSPANVLLTFSVKYNPLLTLKGAPDRVGHSFDVRYTSITSLEGAPGSVGDLKVSFCKRLTSAKGLPRQITGRIEASSVGPGFEDSLAAEQLLL